MNDIITIGPIHVIGIPADTVAVARHVVAWDDSFTPPPPSFSSPHHLHVLRGAQSARKDDRGASKYGETFLSSSSVLSFRLLFFVRQVGNDWRVK